MKEREGEALCFDDILLVPQSSTVMSRSDVDIKMDLDKHLTLPLPVVSSPMDTVTGGRMAKAMYAAGGLGIIHRYNTLNEQAAEAAEARGTVFGGAVGATGDYMERAWMLYGFGASVILVDVANGHNLRAVQAVEKLKAEFNDVHIMAGNISTWVPYYELARAGADSIRVGIGGGSCCTTRLVTGHGLPTLASIIEVAKFRDDQVRLGNPAPTIIADGGLRTTSDMIKAFAAGADAVMLGSMLAGTDETPGEVVYETILNEKMEAEQVGYKEFRGMASAAAQESRGRKPISRNEIIGSKREAVTKVEGISTTIKSRGPVQPVLDEIAAGLRSGCSYSGVSRLRQIKYRAEYVRVSSASLGESRPHAL